MWISYELKTLENLLTSASPLQVSFQKQTEKYNFLLI